MLVIIVAKLVKARWGRLVKNSDQFMNLKMDDGAVSGLNSARKSNYLHTPVKTEGTLRNSSNKKGFASKFSRGKSGSKFHTINSKLKKFEAEPYHGVSSVKRKMPFGRSKSTKKPLQKFKMLTNFGTFGTK